MSEAGRRVAPSPYREALKTKKKQPAATQVTKEPPVPGFSAGTSRPLPPPAPDRRALVVGAAAVAMLVVAGAAVALVASSGGGSDESESPPEAVATNVSTTVASETAPGTGGDGTLPSQVVQVVDHGWYVNDDQVGSYGFVIENTSDEKLGPFLVRVTGYDGSGAVISGLDDWTHLVGMMQPREKVGIADQLDDADQADDGISRLELAVVEVASDPMKGVPIPDSIPDGEIHVGNVEVDAGDARTVISYDATSSFAETFEGKAYLLFRDGAGRIVGGTSSFVDLPAEVTAEGDFELDALSVPPEMADMEVYVVPSLTFDFRRSP